MNIIVKTASGHILTRPDTTWEKDSEDFYPPEFVEALTFTPTLFCRISKSGRCVGQRFASRYYDGIGFGVLLYPEDLIDGSTEGFAQASCLDHTSFLPFPVHGKPAQGLEADTFTVLNDGKTAFSESGISLAMIDDALAEATRMLYIRTGDLLVIELTGRKPLAARPKSSDSGVSRTGVKATWDEDTVLDFSIIF